ncbi:MAG: hypothetical protein AAFW00_28315, partial [Bacteroidota bacterium]
LNEFFFKILPNKLERKFKKYIKNQNGFDVLDVQSFLNNLDENEQAAFLAKNPYTYILLRVMLSAELEGTKFEDGQALLYRSVLLELSRSDLTTRDMLIARWLLKQMREAGIEGDVKDQFARKRAKQYIFELDSTKAKVEDDLDIKLKEIASIEEAVDSLTAELKSLDQARIKKVEVRQVKLSEYKKIARDLKNAQQKLSNSQLSLDGNNTVKISTSKGVQDNIILVSPKEYKLGSHCDEDIRVVAQSLINLFLFKVSDLPPSDVANLEFDLEIVGHADGYGYGKSLNIKSGEDLSAYRYEVNGKSKRSGIKKNKNITNEQLGFLRAYCAYNIFYIWLLEQNIDLETSKHSVRFKVVEHKEKGPAYRKIDIDFQAVNLYEHYEKEIQRLKTTIARYELRENQLSEEIDELRERLRILNDLIKKNGRDGIETQRLVEEIRQVKKSSRKKMP